jgi:hypothetical protein
MSDKFYLDSLYASMANQSELDDADENVLMNNSCLLT